MPEILPLNNVRTGGVGLGDWVSQAGNEPVVDSQLTILVPTQDMLPFQRRIFTRELDAASVPIGQRATFVGTVPAKEAWRILWIGVRHSDPTSLIFSVELNPATPSNVNYAPVRVSVDSNTNVPLYPASEADGVSNRFFQHAGPPLELFEGDQLRITQVSLATAIELTSLVVRYELIPPARVLGRDGVFGFSIA